jgi:hypothetical protein
LNVMTVSRSAARGHRLTPLDDANMCSRWTSKGSISGQLQRALAARDVLAVRSLAGELPNVPLQTAAEITLLLRERERKSYAPAARRLLAGLRRSELCRYVSSPRLRRSWPSSKVIQQRAQVRGSSRSSRGLRRRDSSESAGRTREIRLTGSLWGSSTMSGNGQRN